MSSAELSAVTNAVVPGRPSPVDIHLAGGLIDAIEPAGRPASPGLTLDAARRAVIPAPVDAHVHLDKAHLLDRTPAYGGTLQDAIRAVSALRPTFTADDIAARSERVLGALDARGVRAARVHVEVEPQAGLVGVEATLRLRDSWAGRVDLQLVAFPQDGALTDPATGPLLDEAMRMGCDVVGACPYADADPAAAVHDAFDRAERFGAPVDFHVDFTDDPSVHVIDEVCEQTRRRGHGGRVVAGHVTSLAAMDDADASRRIAALAEADVAVVALPTTDLFLSGRDASRPPSRGLTRVRALLRAGVTVALATNNHANAFTPVSAPDPLRAAWLAFLLAHCEPGDAEELLGCVGARAARAIGIAGGELEIGQPADLIVVDADRPGAAVLEVPDTLARVRGGRLRDPMAAPRTALTTHRTGS